MLHKIKGKLGSYIYRFKKYRQLQSINISRTKRNILVFQTPVHTNIGDHAIAEAEIVFLKKEFPNHNIVEINQFIMDDFISKRRKVVKSSDIIVLIGGGNFGNQYLNEEKHRRLVIESFPNNKIISFPQTIYYTKDNEGEMELKVTQRIVERHKNLYLIAREKTSFQMMSIFFPSAHVILTPDIVLSMEKNAHLQRKGALMVLRNDAEKILSEDFLQNLDVIVKRDFDKVTYSDMHYHESVMSAAERDNVLDYKFKQFQSAEIAITDRLHGMVFAAITGTPCIAFSNYNQKVSGTYEWIKDLPYIRFVQEGVDIEREIEHLLQDTSVKNYEPQKYDEYFKKIVNVIND